MNDIDGTWISCVTMESIVVSGMPDHGGSGVSDWIVTGPHRVLQMIDPNSGQGSDTKEKQRYQYVKTQNGVLLHRVLPPESFGNVWRGDSGECPFTPMEPTADGYIERLLDEIAED